jgi:3-methyladenine DNA glycosylase AlkD
LQAYPLPNIEIIKNVLLALWEMDKREYPLAAIQVLGHYHKLWELETIELIEHCLKTHSWWDTVDNLNTECVSKYFIKFPNNISIVTKWNNSGNMWLQRSSIIFQKAP